MAFLKRHPEVTEHIASHSASKVVASENQMQVWHEDLKNYLDSKNLLQLIPNRIYFLDSIELDLETEEDENGVREQVFVIIGANAEGKFAPLHLVVNNRTLFDSSAQHLREGWTSSYQNKETSNFSEVFYNYVTTFFHPWLQSQDIKCPVLFYINGSKPLLSMNLSNFCKNNLIELIIINQTVSNAIQILDLGLFHSLKAQWNENLRMLQDGNLSLFPRCIFDIVNGLDCENSLKNSFELSGLYPVRYSESDFKKFKSCNNKEKKATKQLGLKINPQLIGHFNYLNRHIEPEILELFKSSGDEEWQGEAKYEGLYEVWLKIKRKVYYEYTSDQTKTEDQLSLSLEDFLNQDLSL